MGGRRRICVLVVDGAPAVLGSVCKGLEGAGFIVRRVTGPDDALATIKDDPNAVDVLLSDVVMAGIGGLELADRAREIAPQLTVILMSDLTPVVTWSGCMVVDRLSIAGIIAAIERATSRPRKPGQHGQTRGTGEGNHSA